MLESSGADKTKPDGPPRRLVCIGSHLGFHPANFFPSDAGEGYTPTSTLKPLQKHLTSVKQSSKEAGCYEFAMTDALKPPDRGPRSVLEALLSHESSSKEKF